MNTKKCNKCLEVYPITKEYFHVAKNNKDGFHNVCKVCRNKKSKEDAKKRYEENYEKVKESQKKYYESNKDKINARKRVYRLENLDTDGHYHSKIISNQRAKNFRDKNREKYNSYQANYRKDYRQSERGKMILNISHYKSQARFWYGEIKDDFTIDDWEYALDYFNHACAYCGNESELIQEHVKPISQSKDYTKYNIVPACRSCNSSKKLKTLDEFLAFSDTFTKERYLNIKSFFERLKQK